MADSCSPPSDVVMHVETKQGDKETRLEEISKELLSDRPDLAQKMKDDGWNVLHCASFAGRDDVVTQILSVTPDLVNQATADENLTALALAANERHENVALGILETCPSHVNHIFDDGYTVLHLAASGGFRSMVAHILATHPAMVNAVTNEGDTPLHFAAIQGDVAVVSLLSATNPALIDATTNQGWTPLHHAAFEGHADLVAFFLTKSVPHRSTQSQIRVWTPVHCAAMRGHISVVQHLHAMSPGSINVATVDGWNAVHAAFIQGPLRLRNAPVDRDSYFGQFSHRQWANAICISRLWLVSVMWSHTPPWHRLCTERCCDPSQIISRATRSTFVDKA